MDMLERQVIDMISHVPEDVSKIWNKWNLRSCILLSLSLQAFLILFAPMRKITSNKFLTVPIWSAYLLADWAANFSIGLISSNQGETDKGSDNDNGDLLAFWAPFLLLHLGGPDSIIAISIEDNALWLRHFLGLIFQVFSSIYVFIQSSSQNKLQIPTVLLFLAGIIKYGERTRGLYLASLDGIKVTMIKPPDPGPNYAKFTQEYTSRRNARVTIHAELTPDLDRNDNESKTVNVLQIVNFEDKINLVKCAHHFFEISRGLVIGLVFSFTQRSESREFYLKTTPEQALELIATELNFIYEALYTKVVVVHSSLGYLCRSISFSAVLVALLFFHIVEKHGLHRFDVGITYTLLYGAICLDAIALYMLIFSDWTVATLKNSKNSCRSYILRKWLNCSKGSRWSNSVSAFNLIDYSLKDYDELNPQRTDYVGIFCRKTLDFLGLKNLRDKMIYQSSNPLNPDLWSIIFEQLKTKSKQAEDPRKGKEICSARGEWVIDQEQDEDVKHLLRPYAVDFNFDQSLLMWHIATELCYIEDKGSLDETSHKHATYSKTLSDYMLYLLVMQPTMLSSVAGIGQVEFWDTAAEAKKFFSKKRLARNGNVDACIEMLNVNTDLKPAYVKGGNCKSVLFDACILAKDLRTLNLERKWKLMNDVWVELLMYAASHCRANSHAEILSKGGELVTFVWLLMTHLGISENFQVKEDQRRVKLLVS